MDDITKLIENKKVCILGYGKEGKSTFNWMRKNFPSLAASITLADQNPAVLHGETAEGCNCKLRYGFDYLTGLDDYDVIIKSPGINLSKSGEYIPAEKIISQTDIFLRRYSRQCIGITGTKGKSTCSSMLYEMLKNAGKKVRLLGNIGTPPLDAWDEIEEDELVVFEMSSHQLEYIHTGPHIAILLNLFQEHLDHYSDFRHYQLAKFNITLKQQQGDVFITHLQDKRILHLLDEANLNRSGRFFSLQPHKGDGMYRQDEKIIYRVQDREDVFAGCDDLVYLRGEHNVLNTMAAGLAALEVGCDREALRQSMRSFKGLEHRMEFVGTAGNVAFYNDAIATIPEATIAAIEALGNIGTLILGGFDRGIDYSELAEFLLHADIENLVFMGEAGERIFSLMKKSTMDLHQDVLETEDLSAAVEYAMQKTPAGKICLLSPAAASYDRYRNFMEKGDHFRSLVMEISEDKKES